MSFFHFYSSVVFFISPSLWSAALDTFCDGLNTLIHHTFEDTFLTIKQMYTARIEYDAYRKEAEVARTSPRKSAQPGSPQSRRTEEAISRFATCETNLNKLKTAVDAKLRLLHENRVCLAWLIPSFYSLHAQFSSILTAIYLTLSSSDFCCYFAALTSVRERNR